MPHATTDLTEPLDWRDFDDWDAHQDRIATVLAEVVNDQDPHF